jgi:hypothetical protein
MVGYQFLALEAGLEFFREVAARQNSADLVPGLGCRALVSSELLAKTYSTKIRSKSGMAVSVTCDARRSPSIYDDHRGKSVAGPCVCATPPRSEAEWRPNRLLREHEPSPGLLGFPKVDVRSLAAFFLHNPLVPATRLAICQEAPCPLRVTARTASCAGLAQ